MKGKLTHEEMKQVLPAGKQVGKEYETTCPLCGHGHLRLFKEGGVKCMNGCETQAVVAWLRDRIKPEGTIGKKLMPSERPNYTGFTLDDYCKLKSLSSERLQLIYGSDPASFRKEKRAGLVGIVNGKRVVTFPYMDRQGNVLGTKVRRSYDSHDTYWDPKDPHIPYGLWFRPVTDGKPRDIVLCEGESDHQTLTLYNIPALGISGSQGWRPEYADLPAIKDAERVFVIQESDKGGQDFVDKIAETLQVYVLHFAVKDASELHIKSAMDKGVTVPCLPKSAFLAAFETSVTEALAKAPTELKKSFRYTDSGNAERLVHMHGANFRYIKDEKVFAVWNGELWERSTDGNFLLPATKEVARSIPDAKWAHTSESLGKRQAMIQLSKGEPAVLTRRDTFDRNPMLLNVKNGTLDLETQELREFSRDDYQTKQAPVVYDPFAVCPQFKDFLQRIFNGDQDLIHFVVKALGYSLTGSAKEQCFFLCHGTGANGKSTLFETIKGLLGHDYTEAAGFATFVERKNQDASGYDIALLPGRRMVTISEPSKVSRLNEELLKQVTGNEVIKARQIYGVPFSFIPECKLWFAMNQDPKIEGTDEGIWRRVRYVPFTVQIPKAEQIQDYQSKLIHEEGSGILNLLLEGTRDWIKDGLKSPAAVSKATTAFRSKQDVLNGFFDECTLRENAKQHVKASVLYEVYKQWAERYGEFSMRLNDFFEEVVKRGYKKRRHKDGVHYFGLTLRSQPDEMNELELLTTTAVED